MIFPFTQVQLSGEKIIRAKISLPSALQATPEVFLQHWVKKYIQQEHNYLYVLNTRYFVQFT